MINRILVAGASLLVVVLVISVLVVWPPDVMSRRRIELTKARAGADSLVLYQFWNGVDFYTIMLEDRRQSYTSHYVVDPDSPKAWTASIIGQSNNVFSVFVNTSLAGYYSRVDNVFTNANGVAIGGK